MQFPAAYVHAETAPKSGSEIIFERSCPRLPLEHPDTSSSCHFVTGTDGCLNSDFQVGNKTGRPTSSVLMHCNYHGCINTIRISSNLNTITMYFYLAPTALWPVWRAIAVFTTTTCGP